MTSTATPVAQRDELARALHTSFPRLFKEYAPFEVADWFLARLAAKLLADEGREATIKECAKIASDEANTWIKGEASTAIGQAFQRACRQISLKISALSTTGAKP